MDAIPVEWSQNIGDTSIACFWTRTDGKTANTTQNEETRTNKLKKNTIPTIHYLLSRIHRYALLGQLPVRGVGRDIKQENAETAGQHHIDVFSLAYTIIDTIKRPGDITKKSQLVCVPNTNG